MLVSRSHTATVGEALESTFDGKHPCGLCAAIASAQSAEQHHQQEAPALKKAQEVKFVAQDRCVLPLLLLCGQCRWPELVESALIRTEAPPTPPPLA